MAWHTIGVKEALNTLQSSLQGLDSTEVTSRLSRYGYNQIQMQKKISLFMLFLGQFKNVLIITLLVATTISAFLGHGIESIAITVIILFAVFLGFLQELRAEKAIEALKKMAAPNAKVVRNGSEHTIPASELVPGDLFMLAAGDKVPADGRLVDAVNLRIEEASLTGESVASEKDAEILLDEQAPVGDRKNMVFAGTSVTYGRGKSVVTETGMHTEFGKIARMLQSVETERTPLQKNLDNVGKMLARAAIVIVAGVVALGLFRGQPVIEMLIFGIALAVAVVPEALPAVVTISLALGVQRMAKRHALMRRLPAVETLGSTTVICSDKTGTLTRDEMTVRQIYTSGAFIDVSGSGYVPEGRFSPAQEGAPTPSTLESLLLAGVLCNDSRLEKNEAGEWDISGDPTEGALLVVARKSGIDEKEMQKRFPRTQEEPFSSDKKRMITLNTDGASSTAYIKGAPEIVVSSCAFHATDAGDLPLDAAGHTRILDAAATMATGAMRVLAVARKQNTVLSGADRQMTFLGLVGMIDPPREEAKQAVATCVSAGIRPVMITGDHPLTARTIARELGILGNGRVVTGVELQAMSDEQLRAVIGEIEVFARVAPEHKLRIVDALQKSGHIVAMTGDGVNDAPALKKADIGISMGITGTDVTKEASAMMLTDDNFASIVSAVEEGRGIYDNIKKYLTFLLSSNIGEIGLMAGAALFGMPLPLSAVQILYVNLATDGLPALALAVDPMEKNIMTRKPNDPKKGIFSGAVLAIMLAGGFWSAIVNILLFQFALSSGRSLAEAMTMTFVSLVLIQFFQSYNCRSINQSLFKSPFANRWLNRALLWELMLLVAVVYLPILQKALGTFSLTGTDWAVAIIAAVTIVPVIEITKWFIRRSRSRRQVKNQ